MKKLGIIFIFSLLILSGCGKSSDPSSSTPEASSDSDVQENISADTSNPPEFADVSKSDSRDIAEAYVRTITEFTEYNAREFKYEDGEETFCDSCFSFIFSFEADSEKEDYKVDRVYVKVNVQGGEVVNHSSWTEGLVERPPEELCQDVLECEDGRTFPIEQYNFDEEMCERIVYLNANPCFSGEAEPLVANTEELKNCVDQGYVISRTPSGDYLCEFPDKSYCEVGLLLEGECLMGDCFKECRVDGDRGEGLYSSCTGNLIELRSCSE